MTPLGGWNRLPEVLRERPQWAVAGANKAPMAVGADGKVSLISVTAPSSWMTFEQAVAVANANAHTVTTHTLSSGVVVTQTGYSIGYILNEADPFTCIDLDVKDVTTHPNEPDKWTTADDFARYVSIVTHFDSYTERSKSRKGLHIWIRGNIGRGFRREGVEVYSQERFIISTGDVWISKPVEEREYLLANMIHQMRPMAKVVELEELPEVADDWYILQIAISASNADKFTQLWKGLWRDMDFQSQSEADLALMSMFTFYSPSNEQCRRLFRESGLGKRDKATKNDRYLNTTLKIIRDRQERENNVELSGILAAADNMLALSRQEITALQGGAPPAQQVAGAFGAVTSRVVVPLQVPGTGEAVLTNPPPAVALAQLAPVTAGALEVGSTGLGWPPGFMGTIAQFMFNSSYLPIKEVCIASALGLMAGICGKAWHIPMSGLNLYIVLIARSAIGKEALHSNISKLVSVCKGGFAQFGNYVDFNEYASGPALIKACAASTSFVNVSGEWGRRMKRIAGEDDREGPMTTLRTQMTNLYQKSAPSSIVGGMGYSSQENNVESMTSVAYSLVGESTPQTFYDSLTESMMEDGFLSRFLVIAYEGERPYKNKSIIDMPDDSLIKGLCEIAYQAETKIGAGESQIVGRTEEAASILEEFETMADNNIRSTNDEARRQMWNRATLKVLRVSALLAVTDNHWNPVITADHCNWAIQLIRNDIEIMRGRLDSGDVGLNDSARERKLVAIMHHYLKNQIPPSYKVPDAMREGGIIPRPYMQIRTSRASAFYKHKFGPSKALDDTLHQLMALGYIMEVKGDKLVEAFSFHGKAYRILKLPDYEALAQDKE